MVIQAMLLWPSADQSRLRLDFLFHINGDMSQRVMTLLEEMAPAVEVYSIDKSKLYSAGTQTYKCQPWTSSVYPGALNGDARARSFRSPLPRSRRERRRILPQ
ncbi:hypothetical protein FA227_27145 [Pseudomonas aeruginosa]|nr:hypothetical protein [Pseudomonas aeruginosa]MCO3162291.1 hypothetical protein [Pseudomonas aeruginosa]